MNFFTALAGLEDWPAFKHQAWHDSQALHSYGEALHVLTVGKLLQMDLSLTLWFRVISVPCCISFLLRLPTVLVSSALVAKKRGGLNDSASSSTLIHSIRLVLSTSLLATASDNWQSLVMPFSTTLRAHMLDTLVLSLHSALPIEDVGCRLRLNFDKPRSRADIRPTLECWFFHSYHLSYGANTASRSESAMYSISRYTAMSGPEVPRRQRYRRHHSR